MEKKKTGNWHIRLKPQETKVTAKGTVITNHGDTTAKITINETEVVGSSKGNTNESNG